MFIDQFIFIENGIKNLKTKKVKPVCGCAGGSVGGSGVGSFGCIVGGVVIDSAGGSSVLMVMLVVVQVVVLVLLIS